MPKEFFQVQSVENALKILFEQLPVSPRTEIIPVRESPGRVVVHAPLSPIALPGFNRSTMDGYAVRAADTFGASQSLPAYLTLTDPVPMGAVPTVEIQKGQAAEIYTGGMLPPGADAVVMMEKTQKSGTHEIEVLAPVAPGENLVKIGEDVAEGAEILPAGYRMRPQDIGGLLAVGILDVEVAARPVVAIVGSGDELVPPEQSPLPGQIRDINSYTLAALIESVGGTSLIMGISEDTPEALYTLASAGFEQSDMLIVTAGSSISTRDLTAETINRLGKPGILQHGLAVKPGKPTILAVCNGKPVIGLPGNPVSAFLVARQIVLPVLRRLQGEKLRVGAQIQAVLSQNIPSETGREDTVPVRLMQENGRWLADPIFGKSNLIFTLIQADGVVVVPLNIGGLKAGSIIEVELF